MKTTILLSLIILFCSSTSFSQEVIKQKEIGISFSNFDSFGFFYRTGKPSAMWRFNSVFGSGYSQQQEDDTNTYETNSFGFSVSAGREYRKILIENLEGRAGFDVALSYQSYKNEQREYPSYTSSSKAFTPGLNVVFGLNYIVKQRVILGAELLPGFYYTTGKITQESSGETNTIDVSNIGFSLSNMARLTVAYRF
jgi:hypothetical protein